MKNFTLTIAILLFSITSSFSQDSIESLTNVIEASPNVAENYMKRYEFYKDAWERDQKDFESLAHGIVDLSKYISLKPNDAEAYRIRAAVRKFLFLGVNPFTIADLKKAVALDPKDKESANLLAEYQIEYKKMYQTKDCAASRSKNGFQGDASEPMTVLAEILDPSIDEATFDLKDGLKAIACGADVNYIYKKDSRSPEFASFSWIKTVHIIAMLEAGAKTEAKDKFGNTILMKTLQRYLLEKGNIFEKEHFIDKLKILLQYGANVNAKNLKGHNVMFFAKKTGNKEVIDFLASNIVRIFDGTWIFDDGRFGLNVEIKEKDGKLTGDYGNFSSKQSEGKILSSKINGNIAIIEVDCDWGGRGTVQITRLKGNKLHWKVTKRDESKGDFIVLVDRILTRK